MQNAQAQQNCTHTRIHVHIHTQCVCVCMSTHMYACTYKHVCVCICIHLLQIRVKCARTPPCSILSNCPELKTSIVELERTLMSNTHTHIDMCTYTCTCTIHNLLVFGCSLSCAVRFFASFTLSRLFPQTTSLLSTSKRENVCMCVCAVCRCA